jgi:hypothetical protein
MEEEHYASMMSHLEQELGEAYRELNQLRIHNHNIELELERAHTEHDKLLTKYLEMIKRGA